MDLSDHESQPFFLIANADTAELEGQPETYLLKERKEEQLTLIVKKEDGTLNVYRKTDMRGVDDSEEKIPPQPLRQFFDFPDDIAQADSNTALLMTELDSLQKDFLRKLEEAQTNVLKFSVPEEKEVEAPALSTEHTALLGEGDKIRQQAAANCRRKLCLAIADGNPKLLREGRLQRQRGDIEETPLQRQDEVLSHQASGQTFFASCKTFGKEVGKAFLWSLGGAALGAAAGLVILGALSLPLVALGALIGLACYAITKITPCLNCCGENDTNASAAVTYTHLPQ